MRFRRFLLALEDRQHRWLLRRIDPRGEIQFEQTVERLVECASRYDRVSSPADRAREIHWDQQKRTT